MSKIQILIFLLQMCKDFSFISVDFNNLHWGQVNASGLCTLRPTNIIHFLSLLLLGLIIFSFFLALLSFLNWKPALFIFKMPSYLLDFCAKSKFLQILNSLEANAYLENVKSELRKVILWINLHKYCNIHIENGTCIWKDVSCFFFFAKRSITGRFCVV